MYSYVYKGKRYIGSTTNLNKRKEEHMLGLKTGYTKLKKAFTEYGYNNFVYSVLETIRYNNIKELWECEDKLIENSIALKTDIT